MHILLDTHCLLWMLSEPNKLGPKTQRLLDDSATKLSISTASHYEIAIKYSIGKLLLPKPPEKFIFPLLSQLKIEDIAIDRSVAHLAGTLPWHHKDPFDRLIVAQAMVSKIPIVTADDQLAKYSAKIIHART
jgi:PIN domain nuclease of toxin-antitoxin system